MISECPLLKPLGSGCYSAGMSSASSHRSRCSPWRVAALALVCAWGLGTAMPSHAFLGLLGKAGKAAAAAGKAGKAAEAAGSADVIEALGGNLYRETLASGTTSSHRIDDSSGLQYFDINVGGVKILPHSSQLL